MITLPVRRVLLLVALSATTACSAHRMAGSMGMPPGGVSIVRVRSADAAEVSVEVWNKGPGDVTFERVLPPGSATAKGTLLADGERYTWQATTPHLELVLRAKDAEATIAYTVRSNRGVEIYVGEQ